jgi:GTP1/Obg family GTP-binding protein
MKSVNLVKSLVATLSLKRMSDNEIIDSILHQTNKRISRRSLYQIRQSIKKDSYQWYKSMREGQYEYLHEFKERINEIMDLQKMHHELIENNKHNPSIQQVSLAELHRLNITLSNYVEVLPTVINNYGTTPSISTTPEDKTAEPTEEPESIITV